MGHIERLIAEAAVQLHAAGYDAITEDQLLAAISPSDDPHRRKRDSYRYAVARMRRRGLLHWSGKSDPLSYSLSEKARRELTGDAPDSPLIIE